MEKWTGRILYIWARDKLVKRAWKVLYICNRRLHILDSGGMRPVGIAHMDLQAACMGYSGTQPRRQRSRS
jgi:hypothetical protein